MREKLESEIYRINRELTLNEQRWREMNHLVLSAQKDMDLQSIRTPPPRLSRFLGDMGLTTDDLIIDKKLVFVLTPFHESQRKVFDTIVETCRRYGFRCVRGDEEFVRGDIFPVMVKNIVQARLIVANIEGRNPNVLYELGIAHAIDKPIILVSKSISDVPFDMKSRSIVLYTNLNDLRRKIGEAIVRATLAEDTTVIPKLDIDRDMENMFLKLLDTLTLSHLKVLEFLDNPREYGAQHGVKFGNYSAGGVSTILEEAIPELKGRREFYDQLVRDLYAKGLLNTDEIGMHALMTDAGMFSSRTTELGKKFLAFTKQSGRSTA